MFISSLFGFSLSVLLSHIFLPSSSTLKHAVSLCNFLSLCFILLFVISPFSSLLSYIPFLYLYDSLYPFLTLHVCDSLFDSCTSFSFSFFCCLMPGKYIPPQSPYQARILEFEDARATISLPFPLSLCLLTFISIRLKKWEYFSSQHNYYFEIYIGIYLSSLSYSAY